MAFGHCGANGDAALQARRSHRRCGPRRRAPQRARADFGVAGREPQRPRKSVDAGQPGLVAKSAQARGRSLAAVGASSTARRKRRKRVRACRSSWRRMRPWMCHKRGSCGATRSARFEVGEQASRRSPGPQRRDSLVEIAAAAAAARQCCAIIRPRRSRPPPPITAAIAFAPRRPSDGCHRSIISTTRSSSLSFHASCSIVSSNTNASPTRHSRVVAPTLKPQSGGTIRGRWQTSRVLATP